MLAYAWLEGTRPRRRTGSRIGSLRPCSSPASASCNRTIGTCRSSSRGFLKSVMKLWNAPSAQKAPQRPLSPTRSKSTRACRNRPKRKSRAEFSVLRSAPPIVSGRAPLARFQNSRNGGSIAGRLGPLAPPRALRRARRDERLGVFVVASAERAAWKKAAGQSRAERGLSGATLAPRIKH